MWLPHTQVYRRPDPLSSARPRPSGRNTTSNPPRRFLDWSKAVDSVFRNDLFSDLSEAGLPDSAVALLRALLLGQ
eukprot:10083852-Alexandrium_andersonii.AAC.1